MALQFTVDDLIQLIVIFSYLSSDEEMEVDEPSQASIGEHDQDSDIEVLACYRDTQPFEPQAVAGSYMTTELPGCLNDLSIPEALYDPSSTEDDYPPSDLGDLMLGQIGQSPPHESFVPLSQQPIAHCSQLEPSPKTPQSPPIYEQGPYSNDVNNPWSREQYPSWPDNAQITDVAVSNKGVCGEPNIAQHGDCYGCGKSFDTIKEEIMINYLEQIHIDAEFYHTRLKRRNAFQARMQAGSFIFVPRRTSQAAACDGNKYQVAPNDSHLSYIPGVLPL